MILSCREQDNLLGDILGDTSLIIGQSKKWQIDGVRNITLRVRENLNESTDVSFLAWSGTLFHSGIECGRSDDLYIAVFVCFNILETGLIIHSPGWAFLAQQYCKVGACKIAWT